MDLASTPINTIQPGQLNEPRPLQVADMIEFDALIQRAARRKPATIEGTTSSLNKFNTFLIDNHFPTQVNAISRNIARLFILDLAATPKFKNHPFVPCQQEPLAEGSVNNNLRAIRAAFNRLKIEGMIFESPFKDLTLPSPNYKTKPVPTPDEVRLLRSVIDVTTPEGFRDYAVISTAYESGSRLAGLITAPMNTVDLKIGCFIVTEKGDRTRFVFVGREVQKILWKYVKRYRPEPIDPGQNFLFLTSDGRALTKQRLEGIFRKYALKAGLDVHRFTPHSARHFFATEFVKNGGQLSDLQVITGHSDIRSLSIYLHPGVDALKAAHTRCSPIDHLNKNAGGGGRGAK